MEQIRKPFQGVLNIVRFNWHFYVFAISLFSILLVLNRHISQNYRFIISTLIVLAFTSVVISLLVSYYVYDRSDLYKISWARNNNDNIKILNIHSGFDETSALLQSKYKNAELIVLDFYDPLKHTEVSIKRARNAYPCFENTKQITTSNLNEKNNSIDKIFVTLSAHEIRDEQERTIFFKELNRVLKPTGEIFITEHLRDIANFLAYNIGFFHFLSKDNWQRTIKASDLMIKEEKKITPFITTFTLKKNGTPA